MNKIKRAVHIDFHTMPGIDDFGADFSVESMVQSLHDAHIEYVNMCARCNIGFSYYPTKLGTVYPSMKGDLLGDMIEECHKNGIVVTAYLNGGLNHQLLINHPEFMSINKDGSVYKCDRINDNYFRTPCYNTAYRKYLVEEIREILQKDPDGIFCDCMKPKKCYCPSCIKKMHEKNIDINDDDQVLSFAFDSLRETLSDIRAVVPKDKRLIFNGHPCENIHFLHSHVEVECLVTDPTWGYDFLPAIAPYYRNFSDDLVYMFGRFVCTWGDMGGVKNKVAIENDVYDALMYGYAPMVGDHLHPRYGLDEELYRDVKDVFAYVASLEPWTDNSEPVSEAAIIRNKITYKNFADHVTDSDKGAARLLSELKITYDTAIAQCETTEKYLIRSDGSSYHHYQFDTKTFKPLHGLTYQGKNDESTWSRGQSWGVLGYPIAYSYTKDEHYIDLHKDITYYFLNHLQSDFLPNWDFDYTNDGDKRDSSAAAISVCGMLEMVKHLPDSAPQKKIYKNASSRILESLIDNCADYIEDYDGLICNVCSGFSNTQKDIFAVYGDYPYLEALMRYKKPDWKMYW